VADKQTNQPAELDVVDSWLQEFEGEYVKSFAWTLELLDRITFNLAPDLLVGLNCNIDVDKIIHKISNLTEDELELRYNTPERKITITSFQNKSKNKFTEWG